VALTRQEPLGVARPSFAISPDGRTLVYVADAGDHTLLYLRRLDSFETRPIPKTEGAFDPFFSPDGRWIGFFTEDKVKKILIEGGDPVILGEARIPGVDRGRRMVTCVFTRRPLHRLCFGRERQIRNLRPTLPGQEQEVANFRGRR
jgi:hypothetical protein